jgi:phage terminase large subunit-like protein
MQTTICSAEATPPLWQTLPPNSDEAGAWNYVPGAWFDQDAVDRVTRFVRLMRHYVGQWDGQPFDLLAWQVEFVVAPIFGWKGSDGRRLVRTAWIEVPRKAGKSTIAAALSLYLLLADSEPGARVFAAAGSKAQAGEVFSAAKVLARTSTAITRRIHTFKESITVPATNSSFTVVSSRGDLAHGLNVHGAVVDEIHVHKTPDLIEAIETGTGARQQPLVIFITTADDGDDTSIYARRHDAIVRQAQQLGDYDPTTYGAIWAAPPEADPFDEATWRAAHPGYGITIEPEYFAAEAMKAKNSPAELPKFERLLLNRRTRTTTRWLDIEAWDRSAAAPLLIGKERPAFGGLDLSTTTDASAFVMVSPDGEQFDVMSRFWLPGDNVLDLENVTGVPLRQWANDGHLTLTPGNVIDYSSIIEEIAALAKRHDVRAIAYDPYNATHAVQELERHGIRMMPLRQGPVSLSDPSKHVELLVRSDALRHGGHPVLRWMAGVVEVRSVNDLIAPSKPDRRKSAARIDGIAALVNATAAWQTFGAEKAKRRAVGF